jgi:uncharacterized protein (TIGR02996 family)
MAFPSDLSQRGSFEERALVRAINGNLLERTAPLVFADWLDEHGRTDEAAILRDPRASPVISPFRVLPYWRHSPFFKLLIQAVDPNGLILTRRVKIHDSLHGDVFLAPIRRSYTQILLLDDEEAVLAGIDQWPLLPGEPKPIIRMKNSVQT